MQAGDIVLGKTTRDDVVKRFGQPLQQSQNTVSDLRALTEFRVTANTMVPHAPEPGTYTYLQYSHATIEAPMLKQPRVNHLLNVQLWNGIAVGYGHVLTPPVNPRLDDAAAIARLRQPGARIEDVVAALGEPTGRWIYPGYAVKDGQVLVYRDLLYDTAASVKRDRRVYVFIDPKGGVSDVRELDDRQRIQSGSFWGPMP